MICLRHMYDSIVRRKPPTEGRHWEAAYASRVWVSCCQQKLCRIFNLMCDQDQSRARPVLHPPSLLLLPITINHHIKKVEVELSENH